MVDAIADIETYLAGRSICCKKLSRFSLKDELTFLPWALLFPVALQNYKKSYNWQWMIALNCGYGWSGFEFQINYACQWYFTFIISETYKWLKIRCKTFLILFWIPGNIHFRCKSRETEMGKGRTEARPELKVIAIICPYDRWLGLPIEISQAFIYLWWSQEPLSIKDVFKQDNGLPAFDVAIFDDWKA